MSTDLTFYNLEFVGKNEKGKTTQLLKEVETFAGRLATILADNIYPLSQLESGCYTEVDIYHIVESYKDMQETLKKYQKQADEVKYNKLLKQIETVYKDFTNRGNKFSFPPIPDNACKAKFEVMQTELVNVTKEERTDYLYLLEQKQIYDVNQEDIQGLQMSLDELSKLVAIKGLDISELLNMEDEEVEDMRYEYTFLVGIWF